MSNAVVRSHHISRLAGEHRRVGANAGQAREARASACAGGRRDRAGRQIPARGPRGAAGSVSAGRSDEGRPFAGGLDHPWRRVARRRQGERSGVQHRYHAGECGLCLRQHQLYAGEGQVLADERDGLQERGAVLESQCRALSSRYGAYRRHRWVGRRASRADGRLHE